MITIGKINRLPITEITEKGCFLAADDQQVFIPLSQMKELGTLYCWDNDYAENITDFLQTGREDCIGVGMTYISCHGDINLVACNKRVAIYKGANVYKYACTYTGKTTLKSATLKAVTDTLKGQYGTADTRITNLIDAGFYPASVQTAINTLYKLIKG